MNERIHWALISLGIIVSNACIHSRKRERKKKDSWIQRAGKEKYVTEMES